MYKWLCLFFLIAPLFANEEIVVQLDNQQQLLSVYLHPIEDVKSGFDVNYLCALERVISFDLNYNGRTELVSQTQARENQVEKERSLHVFEQDRWRKLGCHYVVKAAISNRKLSLTIFSVNSGQTKGMDGIALTGKLEKDRRILHSVADSIHGTLFGTRGICSTRILYTLRKRNGASSSDWVTEIWEADYDGANARQITHHNGLCVTPTYVPCPTGGRCGHCLYVCYEVGQPKIYAASIVTGESARLSFLRGNQLMPALNTRIDQMAFISDITGNPDLFVQPFSLDAGLTNKPRQIFCAPGATQGTPTFSPDGKNVAFVSNKDGTPRIYTITIPKPGTSVKDVCPLLISRKNRNNTSPAWSPDGTKIAYSASTGGVRQIWIYDLKTKEETQLTKGPGHKENPAWAANSLHVVFNSSTQSSSELFLINLNQKKMIKITGNSGEKRFPAWEPICISHKKCGIPEHQPEHLTIAKQGIELYEKI